MRQKIRKPDYFNAVNCAVTALKNSRFRQVPMDLLEFCEELSDLGKISFSDFAKVLDVSIAEVCNVLGTELGTLSKHGDRYLLYYNDELKFRSKSVQNFTLAHELGHYFLGHAIGSVSGLSSQPDYIYKEREANCFARNLLVPIGLLSPAVSGANVSETIARISSVFGVSQEAAKVRLEFYDSDRRMIAKDTDFLNSYIFSCGRICSRCGSFTADSMRCENCSKEIDDHDKLFVESLEDDHAKLCIMCGNEVMNNVSCPFCNFPTLNICLNEKCSKNVSDYADVCPYCGGDTLTGVFGK